jgi:rRNA processing protein Krr1/Pno1
LVIGKGGPLKVCIHFLSQLALQIHRHLIEVLGQFSPFRIAKLGNLKVEKQTGEM